MPDCKHINWMIYGHEMTRPMMMVTCLDCHQQVFCSDALSNWKISIDERMLRLEQMINVRP